MEGDELCENNLDSLFPHMRFVSGRKQIAFMADGKFSLLLRDMSLRKEELHGQKII